MLLGKPVENLITTETDESLILKPVSKCPNLRRKGFVVSKYFLDSLDLFFKSAKSDRNARHSSDFCTVISSAGNNEAFIAAPPRPPETLMHLQPLTYVSLTRSAFHSLKSDSASKAPQPIDYPYTAFRRRTPMNDCLRAAAS